MTNQLEQKGVCYIGNGVTQKTKEEAAGSSAAPGPSWEPHGSLSPLFISPLGICMFTSILSGRAPGDGSWQL